MYYSLPPVRPACREVRIGESDTAAKTVLVVDPLVVKNNIRSRAWEDPSVCANGAVGRDRSIQVKADQASSYLAKNLEGHIGQMALILTSARLSLKNWK
jgi:hypothetical protein